MFAIADKIYDGLCSTPGPLDIVRIRDLVILHDAITMEFDLDERIDGARPNNNVFGAGEFEWSTDPVYKYTAMRGVGKIKYHYQFDRTDPSKEISCIFMCTNGSVVELNLANDDVKLCIQVSSDGPRKERDKPYFAQFNSPPSFKLEWQPMHDTEELVGYMQPDSNMPSFITMEPAYKDLGDKVEYDVFCRWEIDDMLHRKAAPSSLTYAIDIETGTTHNMETTWSWMDKTFADVKDYIKEIERFEIITETTILSKHEKTAILLEGQ